MLVDGKIAVQEGRVTTLDEQAITARLAEAASRPRTAAQLDTARTMDSVKDRVKAHYSGWTEKVNVDPYFAANSRTDGRNAG